MNALQRSYLRRSLENHFAAQWTSAGLDYNIFIDGMKFEPSRELNAKNALLQYSISTISLDRVHKGEYKGTVIVDVQVIARILTDVHLVDEIVGTVESCLHRKTVTVYNHPHASPTQFQSGFVRLGEPETVEAGLSENHPAGGSTVPCRQITVTVEGMFTFIE